MIEGFFSSFFRRKRTGNPLLERKVQDGAIKRNPILVPHTLRPLSDKRKLPGSPLEIEHQASENLRANAFFLKELSDRFFIQLIKSPHQTMQEFECFLGFGTAKF